MALRPCRSQGLLPPPCWQGCSLSFRRACLLGWHEDSECADQLALSAKSAGGRNESKCAKKLSSPIAVLVKPGSTHLAKHYKARTSADGQHTALWLQPCQVPWRPRQPQHTGKSYPHSLGQLWEGSLLSPRQMDTLLVPRPVYIRVMIYLCVYLIHIIIYTMVIQYILFYKKALAKNVQTLICFKTRKKKKKSTLLKLTENTKWLMFSVLVIWLQF